MNTQPILKSDCLESGELKVHHLFHSIQGEGPYAGMPAVFIRLNGCNLQCPGCDEEYSRLSTPLTPYATYAYINDFQPVSLIVITGGEPFRQNIMPLVDLLHTRGYIVQIETNGTLFMGTEQENTYQNVLDNITIVCSPKTGGINQDLYQYVDAYKYIIDHEHVDAEDGLPTTSLGHSCKTKVFRPARTFPVENIYVQPMDTDDSDANEKNRLAAINSCFAHCYRYCAQIHKTLGME